MKHNQVKKDQWKKLLDDAIKSRLKLNKNCKQLKSIKKNKLSIKEKNQLFNNSTHQNKECRICFIETEEELIRPCLCNNSIAYVHRTCLRNWIKINRSKNCTICNSKYNKSILINYNYHSINYWLINDLDILKQILCFIIIYSICLIFNFKRIIKFYLNEYGTYSKISYLIDNKFDDLIKYNILDLSKQSKFIKLKNNLTNKFYNQTFINQLIINQFNNLINCINNLIGYLFNDYLTNILFNNQLNQNQQIINNSQLKRSLLNATVDKIESNYRITYSLIIYYQYIVIYLINDLMQIIIYIIVLILFLKYLQKEYYIWRFDNRIVNVEFN